jgi:tripartite-type tricarboxylate transporter receptor subunit TctC
MRRLREAVCAILPLVLWAGLARADAVSDFYTGRTVTVVIGSAAGGTYDLYARAMGRFVGRYIPGNPRVIVQNMPGAASYTAAAHVFNVAPQDGTVIGAISAALPWQPLIDPNSPKLDVPRINWLHSPSTFTVSTIVRSDIPVKTWEDLRNRETVMATIAPGQLPSLIVAATNDTLGTKIKGINGHPGLNDAMLALERGEIEGYPAVPVDALKRLYANVVKAGKVRVLLQYGPAPSPDYPEAPYAVNLVNNPEDRMLLDLAQAPLKVGYIYMLGPNVPKDRIEALRDAFAKTFRDPDFIAECERQTLNIDPVDASSVQALLVEAYKTPPVVVERMRELYRRVFR